MATVACPRQKVGEGGGGGRKIPVNFFSPEKKERGGRGGGCQNIQFFSTLAFFFSPPVHKYLNKKQQ